MIKRWMSEDLCNKRKNSLYLPSEHINQTLWIDYFNVWTGYFPPEQLWNYQFVSKYMSEDTNITQDIMLVIYQGHNQEQKYTLRF